MEPAHSVGQELPSLGFAPSLAAIAAELDPGAFVNTADGVPNSRASLGNPFSFLSLQIPPSVLPLGVPGMDLPTTNGTLPAIFHETGNCERSSDTLPELCACI